MDEFAREPAVDYHSIVALFSRAVEEAKDVARAEVELQTARVSAKIGEARGAVVFLVAALVTGSLASTALVVGALLILTPRVGAIWATVIVVGVLGCAAGLLGWLSLRQFKLLFAGTGKQQ